MTDIIGETFPVSLKLGLVAMAIALVVGTPLGVIGALKHNSILDYFSGFVAIVGISTPSYVIVSLLVLLFASTASSRADRRLGWHRQHEDADSRVWRWRSIRPRCWPATPDRACWTCSRPITSALRERRGCRENAVIIRHAVRNALLPVMTVSGIILADVITGSFFVETVYQVPGIGRYFVDSITQRDYPVILGTVLLLGVVVSVMNLIVDILYPLLDPRMNG